MSFEKPSEKKSEFKVGGSYEIPFNPRPAFGSKVELQDGEQYKTLKLQDPSLRNLAETDVLLVQTTGYWMEAMDKVGLMEYANDHKTTELMVFVQNKNI